MIRRSQSGPQVVGNLSIPVYVAKYWTIFNIIEQKPIKKFGKKLAWAYPGTA